MARAPKAKAQARAVRATVWRPRFKNVIFIEREDGSYSIITAQTNYDARRKIHAETGLGGDDIVVYAEKGADVFTSRLEDIMALALREEDEQKI